MPLDSYVLDYFDAVAQYLAVGPPLYFVVTGGHNYTTWNPGQRDVCSLSNCSGTSLPNVIGAYANFANLQVPMVHLFAIVSTLIQIHVFM